MALSGTTTRIFRMPSVTTQPAFVVYKIMNLIDGKFYIGKSSTTLNARLKVHEFHAKTGGYFLHRAMRKFGVDMFCVTVMKVCESDEHACSEEHRLITAFRPEYNIGTEAPSNWGQKRSPEFSKRMSELKKGKPNLAARGRTKTPEQRAKISAAKKGNSPRPSPQSLEALRANAWKQWQKNSVPVLCVESGKKFDSAAAASRHLGCRSNAVSKVVDKPHRAVFGFRFVRAIN